MNETLNLTFEERHALERLLRNAIMDTSSNKAAALYESILRKLGADAH